MAGISADNSVVESETQSIYEKSGIDGVVAFLKAKVKEWKNVSLRVGVIGQSGAGKSSFINTIRGLKPKDEGAAKVGVNETTTKLCEYPHPTNSQLVLCDLPGVNTPAFPKSKYLKKVDFETFDAFIIITKSRFHADDLWLAQEVKKDEKTFFFVRSNIDVDIENDKRDEEDDHDEEKVLQSIRDRSLKILHDNGFPDCKEIYLISNLLRLKKMWDFPSLSENLINSIEPLKQDAIRLTLGKMSSLTTEQIDKKKAILHARIWQIASLSAAAAAIPFPGIDIASDVALIYKEVQFYKEQFGLEDLATTGMADVLQKYSKEAVIIALKTFLKTQSLRQAVKQFLHFIPFVGSVIAGGIAFKCMFSFLEDYLESAYQSAVSIARAKLADAKVNHI